MPDVAQTPHAAQGKKPIQILRELRGGIPQALMERNRQQAAIRRRIADALGNRAKTVPEIAQKTNLSPHEVFWHLMAMKKYGKLVEGQQREDYFEYALAKPPEPTETAS